MSSINFKRFLIHYYNFGLPKKKIMTLSQKIVSKKFSIKKKKI